MTFFFWKIRFEGGRASIRSEKGGKKRVYSSKYALSSIVFCGQCGDIYRRVDWNIIKFKYCGEEVPDRRLFL